MSSRTFTPEFRLEVAQRIEQGESVSKLHHELNIKRSVLYRWRDAYRKEGEAGLSPESRSAAWRTESGSAQTRRERRRGTAAADRGTGAQSRPTSGSTRFFQKSLQASKGVSQASGNAGATASTRRSGK